MVTSLHPHRTHPSPFWFFRFHCRYKSPGSVELIRVKLMKIIQDGMTLSSGCVDFNDNTNL